MFVMMKVFITLLALSALSACGTSYSRVGVSQLWKPRLASIPPAPTQGPPEYQQGWQDGCESGLATYGNMRYKAVYQFKQDGVLANNPVYYTVWRQAYTFCRYHLLTKLDS